MAVSKLFIILSICVMVLGCKKELPFPDEKAPTQMVVNSLFSPDGLLEVHVSESCHLRDTRCNFNFISDAVVLVKNEQGETLADLKHQGEGIYANASLFPEVGSTYQIEISKSGMTSVTAESRVPKDIFCSFKGKEEGIYESRIAWGFDIEIVDDPNVENFYMMEGFIEIVGGEHESGFDEINGYEEPHSGHFTTDVNSENAVLSTNTDYIAYPLRSVFLRDQNFNGQTYQTNMAIVDYDVRGNRDGNIKEFRAHLLIKSVSKAMYEYSISLERSRLSQGNILAEPEQIHSNINGGLGIFAGYTEKTFVVDLPPSEYRHPSEVFVENAGCKGPCTIKFSTNGGAKLNYNWDFGDGGSSTENSPEHLYTNSGTYYVDVSYSESPGNISSYGIEVVVN